MSVFKNVVSDEYTNAMNAVIAQYSANKGFHDLSFYLIANSAFLWENLPKDCLRYLPEEFLIYWGRFAFWKEGEEYKLFPCYPAGQLLPNGEYSKYTCVSKNGKTWIKDNADVEICFCNSLKMPTISLIRQWSEKCGYSLQTVDTMLQRSMNADIVVCKSKAQQDAISEVINDKDSNLVSYRTLNTEGYEEDTPEKLSLYDDREKNVLALWEIYQKYKGSFFNLYGIYTVGINKSERLTESESKGNSDSVRYSLYSDMYENRLDFCRRVKEHFGVDIQCIKNRSIPVTPEEVQAELEMQYNQNKPAQESKENEPAKESDENDNS